LFLQDRSNSVLAENVINPKLSGKYSFLNACAAALKADRTILRLYLEGHSTKTYLRVQLKLLILM
jgi:hypothetical protein